MRDRIIGTCLLVLCVVAPVLCTWGVWLLNQPAGYIVGGLSCVWLEYRLDDDKKGRD